MTSLLSITHNLFDRYGRMQLYICSNAFAGKINWSMRDKDFLAMLNSPLFVPTAAPCCRRPSTQPNCFAHCVLENLT
jgi:hypothetical protein